jgi:hypothetical protein
MATSRRTLSLAAVALISSVTVILPPPMSNAQSSGGPAGPIRTVLALGRVESMIDRTLEIRLSRVSIPVGALASYSGEQSAVYVLSGAVVVSNGTERQSLQDGDATFVPSATRVLFEATANAPAEILHYQLSATNNPGGAISAPASTTMLRRMPVPRSILRPGPYEFSLARVTLPAGASGPKPHTRSTAALYYVLAGGSITIWPAAGINSLSGESRTEPRPAGSIQEEPLGFIHTWSPRTDAPLILLQANVSQEGAPEIIFVK